MFRREMMAPYNIYELRVSRHNHVSAAITSVSSNIKPGRSRTVIPAALQYNPSLQTVLAALLVMCVSSSLLINSAHADNVPTTITAGTYVSINDTLLGTTLNVSTMLYNATSNNKTEAACTFLRTTFKGTMTVNLPTTAAAWTTNNIPLRLLIQDGITGTSQWPTTFISVTGYLALGSSIIIQGGDYSVETRFVFFQSSLSIQDSSTFKIEGGIYRAILSASNITSFIHTSGSLTIYNNSILSMNNNKMVVADVSVSTSTYWYAVHFSSTTITTSTRSTITISDNVIIISNVRVVETTWQNLSMKTMHQWRNALVRGNDGVIKLNSSSNITIEDNSVTITGVTITEGYMHWFTVYLTTNPIDIKSGSLVMISHNSMTATNVLVRGWITYDLNAEYSGVTLETSNVTISYNKFIMSNSSSTKYIIRGEFVGLESPPFDIKTNSSFLIEYNTYELFDYVAGSLEIVYAGLDRSNTTISTGSTFSISNNKVRGSNVASNSQMRMRVLEFDYSDVTLRTESTISLSSNTLLLEDVSVGANVELCVLARAQCASDVVSGSICKIDNNNITISNMTIGTKLRRFVVESLGGSKLKVDGQNSTLSMSSNVLSLSDVTVGTDITATTLASFEGCDTSVTNGGAIAIFHNTIDISNVSVVGVFALYTFYFEEEAIFDVGMGGSVIVTHNILLVNTLTVHDGWFMYTLYLNTPVSPLTVTDNSLFSISNNFMDLANIDVNIKWECMYVNGIDSSITISNYSNFTIHRNAAVIVGVSPKTAWYWHAMSMKRKPVIIGISSLFSFSDNVLTASNLYQRHWYVSIINCDHSGITTDTGSTFTISNNTMTVSSSNVSVWQCYSVYGYESSMKSLSNSLMSIDNNILKVINSIVSRLNKWEFQWDTCSPIVRSSSTITVSYNTVDISSTTFTTFMSWTVASLDKDDVSISIDSTISFSNNKMWLYQVIFVTYFTMHIVYPSDTNIEIKTGSTFAIDNNNVTASNLTIGSYWSTFQMYLREKSKMTVDGTTSTLSISNNIMSLSDVTVGTSCTMVAYYVEDENSDMIVQNDGTVYISNNTIILWPDVTANGESTMHVLRSKHAPVSISSGSTLAILNNLISTEHGATTSTALCISLVHLTSQVSTIFGQMVMSGNTIDLRGYNVGMKQPPTILLVNTGSTVSGTGSMSIHHNSVIRSGGGIGSMMNFTLGTLGTPTPLMRTCRNYADGQLCVVNAGGVYSCATGSTGLIGNITSCTYTDTTTYSSSHHTSSRSIIATPTYSSQRTLTNTIARTSTLSKKLTSTITTTLSHVATSTASPVETHTTSIITTKSLSVSFSNTPTTSSTPSLLQTNTLSLSKNTPSTSSTTTHPPTSTLSRSASHLGTYSTTQTMELPINKTCNYTCADIVALQVVSGTSPQEAINSYRFNSTTTHDGCIGVTLPFTATYKDTTAWVLLHLAPSSLPLNQSNTLMGMTIATTKPGAMQASVAAANYTLEGGVVIIVAVRRVDASPTNIVSGTVVIPGTPFFCTLTSTLEHFGLPWARIALGAPPPALSEGEKTAVAVLAVTSADLQTVAAIGLLRCSPGSDDDLESEAGIRALVPVALSGTCAGAVQGALLAISVAGILSVVAMCIAKSVKSLSWVEAAALTQCPGIVIAVWAFMQMGLVVCGARLATTRDGDTGDITLGIVGVIAGALLPVVCVVLAWGVVSRRCYRLAQVPKAVAGRHAFVIWMRSVLLPTYELDTNVYPVSRAFSIVVSQIRRPSCVWAGLSVIQPVGMLLVVFVTGDSCDTFLILSGVVMMLVGALCHVLFRPHRIVAANYLQGIAMALNAAVFFVASKLVGDPLNVAALNANAAIAMIQVALSVCRFVHTLSYLVYLRFYGATVLAVVDRDTTTLGDYPDAAITSTANNNTRNKLQLESSPLSIPFAPPAPSKASSSPPTPVFSIHCTLCGAYPVRALTLTCSDEYNSRRSGILDVPLSEVVVTGVVTTTNHHAPISSSPTTTTRTGDIVGCRRASSRRASGGSLEHEFSGEPSELVELESSKRSGDGSDDDGKNTTFQPSIYGDSVAATKKFIWNPKEYVPMERPYTMLYEEDFTPSEDGEDADRQDGDNSNHEDEDDLASLDANNLHDQKASLDDNDDLSTPGTNSVSLLNTSESGGGYGSGYRHFHHSSSSSIDASHLL